MIILSKEQIIKLHDHLIAETGGLNGIRDDGLLDSALNAPFQSFDGVDAFPSIQQKAARLGYGIVKNHAFNDGNKRIGAHTMLGLAGQHGTDLDALDRRFVDDFCQLLVDFIACRDNQFTRERAGDVVQSNTSEDAVIEQRVLTILLGLFTA